MDMMKNRDSMQKRTELMPNMMQMKKGFANAMRRSSPRYQPSTDTTNLGQRNFK